MDFRSERTSKLRKFTRLVIGALSLGIDGITGNIDNWEQSAVEKTNSSYSKENFVEEDALVFSETGQVEIYNQLIQDKDQDTLKYLFIGLIFDIQEQISGGFHRFDLLTRRAGMFSKPYLKPIYSSKLASPIMKRFDRLVTRGEDQVNQWIELGKKEARFDKAVAEAAWNERIDSSVSFLAADAEIQELVQSQSANLLDEVVEETRERTVSADNYLETFIRTIFKRKQRWELPEPPQEVKAQAEPIRKPTEIIKYR